ESSGNTAVMEPSGMFAINEKDDCPGLDEALAMAPKVTPPSSEVVSTVWRLLPNSPSVHARARLPFRSNPMALAVTATLVASDALIGMLNEVPLSLERITITCCDL